MYMHVLCNKIMREKKIPDSWAKIVNKMLYKKGEKNLPKNYRPISLVNTMLKIFTSIMHIRLNRWADTYKKIPEWQASFREKRGTEDLIFVLNTLIQNQLRKKGGKLYTLFVDLKSAFPSVKHSLLWKKLSQIVSPNNAT